MKKSSKILVVLGVIVIVIITGIILLVSNLDSIVKGAIEKYGSRATGTEVKVGKVHISLKKGEGSISSISVGNPKGFSGSNAFEMDNITIDIETDTLMKKPVVIGKILISDPHINYEINSSGRANINEIKKNLRYIRKGAESADKKSTGGKKTFVIKTLIVEGGRIDARAAALPNESFTAQLPRIRLLNIGGQKGSTPSQLAGQILRPVANEAIEAAAETGVRRYLGTRAEEAGKLLKEGLGEKMDSLGQETTGKAKNSLDKLLGK